MPAYKGKKKSWVRVDNKYDAKNYFRVRRTPTSRITPNSVHVRSVLLDQVKESWNELDVLKRGKLVITIFGNVKIGEDKYIYTPVKVVLRMITELPSNLGKIIKIHLANVLKKFAKEYKDPTLYIECKVGMRWRTKREH